MDVSIAMTLVIFVAAKVIRALIFESYSFSLDKTDLYLGYLKLMLNIKTKHRVCVIAGAGTRKVQLNEFKRRRVHQLRSF